MEESNYEVYQGSKLKKLMELIKFAMQVSTIVSYAPDFCLTCIQDTLRTLVLDSLKSFVVMLEGAAESTQHLDKDTFKWTDPLTVSNFK